VTGTWLASATGGSTAALTALRPQLAALVERFHAEAAAGVPARLRTLLATRVSQMVGEPDGAATDPEIARLARRWPTDPGVSEAERAALDLCESFVMDAHSVTDEQVQRLQAAMGDNGAVAVFMNLAILDGFAKFRRVFAEER